ncbi:MAG: 16S rRNA (uracil(1498)-N(3))-methyltransferase [Acidobacteriota bacterium]|nr:16S rRNA (uracil(1498)-N(3))-methyltransferase [Acidobacteriota bacterium]
MTLLEWPRRVAALAQFRVPDLAAPALGRDDDHHLRRVLRARDGEEVVVTDGRGSWRLCAVAPDGLVALGDVGTDPAPAPTALYLSPVAGDRAEWALAKATELGVARVVPLLARRAAPRFSGAARAKTLARWRRVAAEAAGQCRRTHELVVDEPVGVGEVPAGVCVADVGGSSEWSGVRAVAVGPEGGWEPDEWGAERRRLSLGPSVLRAETAGVVAAALIAFSNASWGFSVSGGAMGKDEATR